MSPTHLAGQQADANQIERWVEQFHRAAADDDDERLRVLPGFLPAGAYG